jgi:pilus assembly protein Flp/PilA
MKIYKQVIKEFLNDEKGATAIEYGLLVALISLVIVAGVSAVGTSMDKLFVKVSECLAKPNVDSCKYP